MVDFQALEPPFQNRFALGLVMRMDTGKTGIQGLGVDTRAICPFKRAAKPSAGCQAPCLSSQLSPAPTLRLGISARRDLTSGRQRPAGIWPPLALAPPECCTASSRTRSFHHNHEIPPSLPWSLTEPQIPHCSPFPPAPSQSSTG